MWGLSLVPCGISWVPWGCSVSWGTQITKDFSLHGTEHPHGTHDIFPRASWYPPRYWVSPKVHKITPTVLMISSTVLNSPSPTARNSRHSLIMIVTTFYVQGCDGLKIIWRIVVCTYLLMKWILVFSDKLETVHFSDQWYDCSLSYPLIPPSIFTNFRRVTIVSSQFKVRNYVFNLSLTLT